MDFSHIINFPEVEEDQYLDQIKNNTAPEHHDVIFGQADKLRQLRDIKTTQMVYVIHGQPGVVPTPKESSRWLTTLGNMDFYEFNAIASEIPITVVTPVINAKECYDKVCNQYGLQPVVKNFYPITKFIFRWLNWCLGYKKIDEPDYDCSKLFICMNGKPKTIRTILMNKLWSMKLLDKAHWSWHGKTWVQKGFTFPHITTNDFPLYEDRTLGENTIWRIDPPDVPEEYHDAYIDVSVETMHEPNAVAYTEKTLRPYWLSKPCIQLSFYGHYNYLESLGIKLYTEMFDYDLLEQPDMNKRVNGIIKNLESLANKTQSEMNALIKSIASKIKHNKDIVCNMIPEQMPTAEIQYLVDHNIIPTDNYVPVKINSIGKKIDLTQF